MEGADLQRAAAAGPDPHERGVIYLHTFDSLAAYYTLLDAVEVRFTAFFAAEIGAHCSPGYLAFAKVVFVLIGFTGSILGLSSINSSRAPAPCAKSCAR